MADAPTPDEFEALGVYDPRGGDADDRLEVLRYLFDKGADVDEVGDRWREYGWHGLTTYAVELAIRPAGAILTFDEGVERSGMGPDRLARFWRALGFPDPRTRRYPFTEEEVEIVRLMGELGVQLGERAMFDLARVIGSSMARIAEAGSNAFRVGLEMPNRRGGQRPVEYAAENAAGLRELLPAAARVFDVVHRRHVVTHAYRDWSADTELSATSTTVTVGFVDLVGYTARTETLSVAELADIVTGFEERIVEIVGDHGGRLVKLIGDEGMFVIVDTQRAVEAARQIVDAFDDGFLPPVRVGLAAGEVVTIHGDYFGPVVNLAARMRGAAEPSTVYVSESVAHAVGSADPVGVLDLKGFDEPVPAFRLVHV